MVELGAFVGLPPLEVNNGHRFRTPNACLSAETSCDNVPRKFPMRTKKTTAPGLESGLSFEQAIQRLEQVVAEMEAADLPLEDVLKHYEEGTRLARFCGQKLDEAGKKIELLARKNDGSPELRPFEPEPETDDGKLL